MIIFCWREMSNLIFVLQTVENKRNETIKSTSSVRRQLQLAESPKRLRIYKMQETKGSNAELVLVANCWISLLPPKSLIWLEGILNKLLMLELLL